MELISPLQQRMIDLFCRTKGSENFYLTGGTALSLFYLKHRRSNDLDFFTSYEEYLNHFATSFEKNLKEDSSYLVERIKKLPSFIEISIQKEEQFTLVHFAVDSPFRFEDVKESKEFPGLKVDNLLDIATNKVLSLFGRATLRDFIDVYFLIKKNLFIPEDLIEKAKIKDPGFDLYWFCIALERINRFTEKSSDMLLLVEKIDFTDVIKFFTEWRKKLSQTFKE